MDALIALLAQVLKPILKRLPFIRSLKSEHAESGLRSLEEAEAVFKASKANGGFYGEPWWASGRKISQESLMRELEMLITRAGDRKLTKKINGIIWGINQIYTNNVQNQIIYVDGMSNRDPLAADYDLEKAREQLKAIDLSLPLVSEARKRINILER
jgi:hypothetical protein